MSTEIQTAFKKAGVGLSQGLTNDWTWVVPMTMVAGAAVATSAQLPAGAIIRAVTIDTPTAFTGTPTNINASVGTAASGAQIMAATDVKAQGHVAGVLAATFDNINYAATAVQTVYFTLAAVGGTAPAGTAYVRLSFGTISE